MQDARKTKKELILELENLRERIAAQEGGEGVSGHPKDGHGGERLILEALDDAVIVTNPDGNILYCNRAVFDLYGWEPEEAVGKSVMDVTVPLRTAAVAEGIMSQLRKGKRWEGEFLARRKDGSLLTVYVKDVPLFDEGGDLVGIVGFSRDVASPWAMKNEFGLVESIAGIGRWEWEVVSGKLTWSPHMKEMLGVTDAGLAVTLKDFTNRILPEDRDLVQREIESAMEKDDAIYAEFRVLNPKRGIRWFASKGRVIRDGEGNPVCITGVVYDLTDQRETERDFIESEKHFRDVLGNVELIAVTLDTKGRVLYCNDFLLKTTGRSREEVIGEDWFEMFIPEDERADLYRRVFKRTLKTGEYLTHNDNPIVTKKGGLRLIHWSNTILTDLDGNVTSVTNIGEDVTERRESERKLSEYTAFLDSIMENSPYAMWISDAEGTVVRTNRSLRETLNLRDEQIVGKYNVLRDKNLTEQKVMTQVRDVFEKMTPARFSIPWFANKAGAGAFPGVPNLCIDVSMFPLADENGMLTNVVCQWIDISERKRAEDALLESERRLHTLMSNLPGMAFRGLNEPDWPVHFTSEGCRGLTGYSSEELVEGRVTYRDIVHPEDRDLLWDAVQEAVGRGIAYQVEYRIITKSGREKWVWEQGRSVSPPGINPQVLEGFITDITERKRAGEEVRIERDRAQMYLDIAGVMFVAIDQDGAVTLVNKRGVEILGYEKGEIIGKNWFDRFLSPDVREEVKEVFAQLMAGEVDHLEHVENRILTKGGGERIIAWHNTVLKDERGGVIGTLSSGEDITERKRAEAELHEHAMFLQTLLNTIPSPVFFKDRQGRYLGCNDAFSKDILGIPKEKIVGRNLLELFQKIPEDLLEAYRQKDLELISRGGSQQYECEVMCADGRRRDFVFSKATFSDHVGKIQGLIGVMVDVSRLKDAEREIRRHRLELEQANRILHKAEVMAGMGSWVMDIPTRTEWWSDGTFLLLGREKEQGVPPISEGCGSVDERVHPDDYDRVKRTIEDALAHPHPFSIEYRIFRYNDNAGRLIHAEAGVEYDQEGRPLRLVGIDRDITEQRAAEEALRESEERFRTIFAGTPMGMCLAAPDGDILEVNRFFCDIVGYGREELLGMNVFDITHPDDVGSDRHLADEVTGRRMQMYDLEKRFLRKDGRTVWVHLTATALPGFEGPLGLGMVEDITDRKRIYEELRDSREKLRELSHHLQESIEEERKKLSRDVHDILGQSLTALKMDASWLVKRLPDQNRKLLERAESMIGLIDSTMQTVQQISLELRPGILDDLGLGDAMEWYTGEFRSHAKLECVFTNGVEGRVFDPDLSINLYRIYQELLTNVARHAAAKRVHIRLFEKDGDLILEVRDDGRGMPKKKADGKKTFGLVGIQERVERFRGSFTITSEKGTRVVVTLPVP